MVERLVKYNRGRWASSHRENVETKRCSLMEWLNQMVSEPYYLCHFLAFFSYLPVRTSASLALSPHISHLLVYRVGYSLFVCKQFMTTAACLGCYIVENCSSMQEIQGILAFLVLTAIKVWLLSFCFLQDFDSLIGSKYISILYFSFCFVSLASLQVVKEETWEAFIADTLFFAKVVLNFLL